MSILDWVKGKLLGPPAGHVLVWLPDTEPDPSVHGISPVGTPEERAAPVQWLASEESPFGLRVLDCRGFTRGSVSTTSNGQELARYIELRRDTGGENVRGGRPAGGREVPCRLEYGLPVPAEGGVFRSRRLEFKWDVTRHADRLIFSRSWSGAVEYVATFVPSSGGLTLTRVEAPVTARSFPTDADNDDQLDLLSVDYLVRSCLLGEVAPHPLPDAVEHFKPDTIAKLSMKWFGCEARYGALVSTLAPVRLRRRVGACRASTPSTDRSRP